MQGFSLHQAFVFYDFYSLLSFARSFVLAFEASKLFDAKELNATEPLGLEEYTITILEPIHYVVRGIDTESLIGVVLTATMLSFHV